MPFVSWSALINPLGCEPFFGLASYIYWALKIWKSKHWSSVLLTAVSAWVGWCLPHDDLCSQQFQSAINLAILENAMRFNKKPRPAHERARSWKLINLCNEAISNELTGVQMAKLPLTGDGRGLSRGRAWLSGMNRKIRFVRVDASALVWLRSRSLYAEETFSPQQCHNVIPSLVACK